jgi:hypothetical protein
MRGQTTRVRTVVAPTARAATAWPASWTTTATTTPAATATANNVIGNALANGDDAR